MTTGVGIQVNVLIKGYRALPDGKPGRLVLRQQGHNRVVLTGRNVLRDLLNGDNISGITDFGFGSGSTAVADSDAALVAETLRAPITQSVKSPSALQVKYFLSSTALNGTVIREIGLFSDSTLFARYLVSPAINKDSTLVFTFSWVITLSAL